MPPPPPRIEGPPQEAAKPVSYKGFLLGGHLGWEAPAGGVPLDTNNNVDASSVSAGGFAYALDGGFRFGRRWYVGFTLEHASFGQGHNIGALGSNVSSVTSDTTLLGLVLAVMVNPDRASAYFEIGVANRWYGFTATMNDGSAPLANGYSAGEFNLGLGVWIPAGRYIRLLPKVSLGLGSFSTPVASSSSMSTTTTTDTTGSTAHAFVMLGVAGFYNIDL
jgi:hypothetical protein